MKKFSALLFVCLLSSCAMPFLPGMPRNPAADVAVPMQLRAATPHVMASINGRQAIPLLLDTGATLSVFEPDVATRCGLAPLGGRRVQIRGVHGTVGSSQAIMNTLQIGPWHATNARCLVRGASSFRPQDLGSAILGMDHFRRYCSFLTIDYQRNTVELGFERSFQPTSPAATRTPFRWVTGMPVIRVSSGGIAWDAVVDSGSSWGIVIDQSTAARLGHAKGGMSLGNGVVLSGVGGTVLADQAGARTIQVPETALCGEAHPGATLYVMPGPKRVGSRFWHGTRLTLDFRDDVLWLER